MQYSVVAIEKVKWVLKVEAEDPDKAYFLAEDTPHGEWSRCDDSEWEIEAVEHDYDSSEIIDAEIVEE